MTNVDEGPDAGHRFHITVNSAGSYGVKGEEGRKDADWWGHPWSVTVREWSLSAALRKAAELGLNQWDSGIEDDEVIGLRPLPEPYMHGLRSHVAATETQTIAVIVLSGSPETGLALSVSSKEGHIETLNLLAHALTAEAM